jgi:hypothetical protein
MTAPISGARNSTMQASTHLPDTVSLYQLHHNGLSMSHGLHSPPVHSTPSSGANSVPIASAGPFRAPQAPVTVPLPCGPRQHQDGSHSDAQQTLMTGAHDASSADATVTGFPNSDIGSMSLITAGQYQNEYSVPMGSISGSGIYGAASGWQAQAGTMALAPYSPPFAYGANGSMSTMMMMQQQPSMTTYSQQLMYPSSCFSPLPLMAMFKTPSIDIDAELKAVYERDIVGIQYLLADPSVVKFVQRTFETSTTAREAVLVLSSIYVSDFYALILLFLFLFLFIYLTLVGYFFVRINPSMYSVTVRAT